MSIIFLPQVELELRKRLNDGPITAYKVFKHDPTINGLIEPFWNNSEYFPGINESNRQSPQRMPDEFNLTDGIFVFLEREDALRVAEIWHLVVVPVQCEEEHLIAAGQWLAGSSKAAMFTKVFIDFDDYSIASNIKDF